MTAIRTVAVASLLLSLIAIAGSRTKEGVADAARIKLALQRSTVIGGALYIGAHPDDENTAVLSYLSVGRGLRTAYLSMTRGEGGQNLLGPEQGPLLGIIRTHELLSARQIDGADQFFTRAIDFGYSKTAEETLRFWGKEEVLSDVVWVIRSYRPDVIITRFPKEGGGHGNHTASAILAEEAFHAAADETKFRDQLQFVKPWKTKRLVWNRYAWGRPLTDQEKAESAKMEIGDYNAVLGKSYSELAGVSRSMHKSQGFGDAQDRGKSTNYFSHVAGEPAKEDLFEGIDLTWKRIPGGAKIGQILDQAYRELRPENPSATIPLLLKAYKQTRSLSPDLNVNQKQEEIIDLIRNCGGIWVEAISSEASATPGSEIGITTTVLSRSDLPFKVASIELLPTKEAERSLLPLKNNEPQSKEFRLKIPANQPYSQPYWLVETGDRALAVINNQQQIGLPESAPDFVARFTLGVGEEDFTFQEPVFFRKVDPVRGEVYQQFSVVPEVSLSLSTPVLIFDRTVSKNVTVTLRTNGTATGTVRLKLPQGWQSVPESIPFDLAKGASGDVRFEVQPVDSAASGNYIAEASIGTKVLSGGLVSIAYDHIPTQTVIKPAQGKLVRLDLQKELARIGYVMGSGDDVPEALKQIGYEVTLLSDEDLTARNLTELNAIVIGVRAYNVRPNLGRLKSKLLDYVHGGGTLIVQYQTAQDLPEGGLGPYPFRISRDRVSVEEAPVTILRPDHVLMKNPNEITSKDFEGWVQERGLYFADQWDPQYQTLLSSSDPGEDAKAGGMLYARYGKGTYVYTAYSWFRQLPAGVAGAYRIFVNLISAQPDDAK